MTTRNIKATEIKRSLSKYNINSSNIVEFYSILNNWVKYGKKISGIINLPDIKKDIMYQLDIPQKTVVKLVNEKIKQIPKVNSLKIGRNDHCKCNSGKKFKKCCGTFKNTKIEEIEAIEDEEIEEIIAEC